MSRKHHLEAVKPMTEEQLEERPDAHANAEAVKSAIGANVIVLANGERRIDFIKRRWTEGATRGAIAKELSELQGKAVPYQIVFQATKGLPHNGSVGRVPKAAKVTEAAEASEDAEMVGEEV